MAVEDLMERRSVMKRLKDTTKDRERKKDG
jgi:hypothetical protein